MAKSSKNKKTSRVYLLLSHDWEETNFMNIVSSENYDDLDKFVTECDLYVEGLKSEFDLTKEYLDEHKEFYLSGCDDMNLVSVADVVIPESREMYVVVGIGDEWCWEASVLGLYSTLDAAWQALAENLKIYEGYDDDYEYSYEEYKSQFLNNHLIDNDFIYWKWMKIIIKGKN